jgi:P-type E1-E2 ATPase
MLQFDIPGFGNVEIEHLVLDFNGTTAVNGKLILGVRDILNQLASHVEVHVITADTFSSAQKELQGVQCKLIVIPAERQSEEKFNYVSELGLMKTVAIGNGRNDALMLKSAVISIAVIQAEGCATSALNEAKIVSTNILDALELLQNPKQIIATLRQ